MLGLKAGSYREVATAEATGPVRISTPFAMSVDAAIVLV